MFDRDMGQTRKKRWFFSHFYFQDFSIQWLSIHLVFLLFERAHQGAGHHRALFFNFCFFSRKKKAHKFYVSKNVQKWVSSYINLCIYNKVSAYLKKGLCGALHLDTLFQTKKNLNLLNDTRPRNLGNKIKKSQIEKKEQHFFWTVIFQHIFIFTRFFRYVWRE